MKRGVEDSDRVLEVFRRLDGTPVALNEFFTRYKDVFEQMILPTISAKQLLLITKVSRENQEWATKNNIWQKMVRRDFPSHYNNAFDATMPFSMKQAFQNYLQAFSQTKNQPSNIWLKFYEALTRDKQTNERDISNPFEQPGFIFSRGCDLFLLENKHLVVLHPTEDEQNSFVVVNRRYKRLVSVIEHDSVKNGYITYHYTYREKQMQPKAWYKMTVHIPVPNPIFFGFVQWRRSQAFTILTFQMYRSKQLVNSVLPCENCLEKQATMKCKNCELSNFCSMKCAVDASHTKWCLGE